MRNDYCAPFSFVYDGIQYKGVDRTPDGSFTETGNTESETDLYTEKVTVLRHAASGIDVICRMRRYRGYDASESTVTLVNNTGKTTGVLTDIRGIDMDFTGEAPMLHGIHGDLGDMYGPYTVDLSVPGAEVVQEGVSGRPTHGNFPYYNLQYGDGGTFIAIGWPGTWRAEFRNVSADTVHVQGGQRGVSVRLSPGESFRLPLVAFLHYSGRSLPEAMNLWRRWFMDCNMRHVEGEGKAPILPVLSASHLGQGADADAFLRIRQAFEEHDIPLDYMWIDAGWYTNCKGETCPWPETGTLEIDRKRYAKGFRDISDAMRASGGGTMLWFEPEVVRQDKEAFLAATPGFRAEWMLGVAFPGTWLEGQLLDFGNPDFRDWLFERITSILDEGGITLYRQDFNVDPSPVWAACDGAAGPDRSGITENRYVTGYLAFWDALIERYPNMMIDSCASGGGRNDLETLRRSVPLHVSDFWDGNPGGFDERQAVMVSLPDWIPYFKLGMDATQLPGIPEVQEADEALSEDRQMYYMRSSYAPWFNLTVSDFARVPDGYDEKRYGSPWRNAQRAYREWKTISKYFYADHYALTPCDKRPEAWRGWAYLDADKDEGFLQLFRGKKAERATYTVRLRGLRKDRLYVLTDLDGRPEQKLSGERLMNEGLSVTLPEAGTSALILIRGHL